MKDGINKEKFAVCLVISAVIASAMLLTSCPTPSGGDNGDAFDSSLYYTKVDINNLIQGLGTAYVFPSADGANGYTLKTDGAGAVSWAVDLTSGGGGDDLGDHTATQNIVLRTYYLSGDGGNEGVYVTAAGDVGIGTNTPSARLNVNGTLRVGAYTLPSTDGTSGQVLKTNGSGTLTWQNDSGSGDNLGNHTATQNIVLGSYYLSGDGGNEGVFVNGSGDVGIGTNTPGAKLDVNGTLKVGTYTFPSSDGTGGQILKTNGSGALYWGADSYWNHIVTQNILLGSNWLSRDGDSEGVSVDNSGNVTLSGALNLTTGVWNSYGEVGIGTTTPGGAYLVDIQTSDPVDAYAVHIVNSGGGVALYSSATASGGINSGGDFSGSGATTNYGMRANATGSATTNYGGYFSASGATTNYSIYASGNAYFTANVSADSFTDRTPYPKDLETAYKAVLSMEVLPEGEYNDEQHLDHSKLDPFIQSCDGKGRDLSATVSAQNEVIKDLIRKIEQLKAQIEVLKK